MEKEPIGGQLARAQSGQRDLPSLLQVARPAGRRRGLSATKDKEIRADLASRAYPFEASPYLSLSVKELHERFGARFILLIRAADRVVTSFVHKGFYRRRMSWAIRVGDGYQDQSP